MAVDIPGELAAGTMPHVVKKTSDYLFSACPLAYSGSMHMSASNYAQTCFNAASSGAS